MWKEAKTIRAVVDEVVKRITERHWFFRTLGNAAQREQSTDPRRYSWVSPTYHRVGGKQYSKWDRSYQREWGNGTSTIVRGKAKNHRIATLCEGEPAWTRGMIGSSEMALRASREAYEKLSELEQTTARLEQALEELKDIDEKQYLVMEEQLELHGQSPSRTERLGGIFLRNREDLKNRIASLLPMGTYGENYE